MEYLTRFDYEDIDNIIVYNVVEPFQWWAIYGKSKYPHLCKVAPRVYQVPASLAENQRAWSGFNNVHPEKRNRLDSSTVEKVVFVYDIRNFRTDTKNVIFK